MTRLTPYDIAHGGEAVARVDGRASFVAGVIPGETVEATLVREKKSWARYRLDHVIDPAPERLDPPCPHFERCGGCDWQFAATELQRDWKRHILASQLAHLGRIEIDVAPTVPTADFHYRNRMDFKIAEGRPALYERGSRTLVPLDVCLLLMPALANVFGGLGDLTGVDALTLRGSHSTGETMAVVTGEADTDAWPTDHVVRRSEAGLDVDRGRGFITEEVAGVGFRVGAGSFFQTNTMGAQVLVERVRQALEPQPEDVLLDGYAGGGLFSVALGPAVSRVTAVELNEHSLADLDHNLLQVDADIEVLAGRFERLDSSHLGDVTLAVVDPPRQGLGREGVDIVLDAAPRRIAYVSCDPASLARDAALIVAGGYEVTEVVPVDMFPQTHHIEAVATLVRR